jgi:hypothetical protein
VLAGSLSAGEAGNEVPEIDGPPRGLRAPFVVLQRQTPYPDVGPRKYMTRMTISQS